MLLVTAPLLVFRQLLVDPYCDNNIEDSKVFVCFNSNTICVSVHSVQPFLDMGGWLGKCGWYTTNTTNSITVQSKEDPSSVSIESFALKTYPNTFGKTVTIPVAANFIIKVYELTGREIGTLIRGKCKACMFMIIYNAASLHAGIYYCRIVASTKHKNLYSNTKTGSHKITVVLISKRRPYSHLFSRKRQVYAGDIL